MSECIKILSSKLSAPSTSDTIRRERLLAILKQSARKRLTTIVAGGGYGKTTIAAQAASSWGMNTVWYRLDESDKDLVAFISYLIAGIRKCYPQFGTATLQCLRESHHPNDEREPLLRTILSELEGTVGEDLVIVMDDYHLVTESQEINETIEMFLKDLSPLIHFILISRSEPALPLSRLRTMREVIDIREEDLAFTPTEIDRLYGEVFDVALHHASIDAIYQKMGGWIAGLILLSHSLRGKPPEEIEKNLLHLKGSQRAIFNYLEENIYGALSSEHKEFLVKTSIFSRIDAGFCDRLLNIDYSSDALRYLERNHLFTSSVDEERPLYSYHQLFRDYLLSRLKDELTHDAVVNLHRDAANLLEESGDKAEAVRHYLLAEEFDRACSLMKEVGNRLFGEGRFHLLNSYLDSIPMGYLGEYPWIQYLQAQLTGLRGKYQQAVEHYHKTLHNFLQQKDEEGAPCCLIELALIQFQTGNLKAAQEKYSEVLEYKNLDPRLRIEALGYQIYLSSYFGDTSFADQCFDEAMALLEQVDDKDTRHRSLTWIYHYQAYRYLFSFDFAKVLEIVDYVRAISLDSEPYRYPVGFYLLASPAYLGLQRYSEGYEAAREALTLLRQRRPQSGATPTGWHLPRLSPHGGGRGFPETYTPWLLAYSALNLAALGRIPEALEDAEESIKCFQKMGCRIGEAFDYSLLSRVYLKSGNRAAAEQWARSGMEAIRGLTVPRTEAMIRFNLAESLLTKGELEEPLRLLTEADRTVKQIWLDVLHSQLHGPKNHGPHGRHLLFAAFQSCSHYLFDPLIIFEKHRLILPLIKKLTQGPLQPYITQISARMTPEDAAKLALSQENARPIIRELAGLLLKQRKHTSPPGLRIYLLGKFRVLIDGEEIPAERWNSRKAKTLFQYLIYSRGRGYLNKEVLMELLWPEDDPTITSKRFHVALASLRKTIEPGMVRGVPSAYIKRLGESYLMDLGNKGWVDTETFTTEVKRAREEGNPERAITHLLNAESLYGGNFLEEELYSEWCCEPREKFRKDYLYVTKRMVAYYEAQDNYHQCLEYAEKHLRVDKYAEDIYRSLMICHWKTGDRFSMARTFSKCRDNIAIELNCPLSEETELLYRGLASAPNA